MHSSDAAEYCPERIAADERQHPSPAQESHWNAHKSVERSGRSGTCTWEQFSWDQGIFIIQIKVFKRANLICIVF